MFEATILRIFSSAHAIRLYDGTTEPLHGHNWTVEVTVLATDLDDIEVVMDFHQLEAAVDAIIGRAHNRCLNEIEPFASQPINPTAERVAWWVATELAPALPDQVRLQAVKVGEAPGCAATYRP